MKIGKWFEKLANHPKVATLHFYTFDGTEVKDATEADRGDAYLKDGYRAADGNQFVTFRSAHQARLGIMGSRRVKGEKKAAPAANTLADGLEQVALAALMEATRIKGKTSRAKVQARFAAQA